MKETDTFTTDQHVNAMVANTEAAVVERLKWVDEAIRTKLEGYTGPENSGPLSVAALRKDVPELARLYEVRALLVSFYGGVVSFRARHGMLTDAEKSASVQALSN